MNGISREALLNIKGGGRKGGEKEGKAHLMSKLKKNWKAVAGGSISAALKQSMTLSRCQSSRPTLRTNPSLDQPMYPLRQIVAQERRGEKEVCVHEVGRCELDIGEPVLDRVWLFEVGRLEGEGEDWCGRRT
jgi:hypothetical protein